MRPALKGVLDSMPGRLVVASALVGLGVALRWWPLGSLGERVPWLTFYPVVTLAALNGGLSSGIWAGLLSCLAVLFGWQAFHVKPVIDDPADWLGMVVFFFNCAMIAGVAEAMKRAQRRARDARLAAETANRAKSTFLANMSHELRTPLNSVLGFSNILQRSPGLSGQQRSHLSLITRSGEHLLQLIDTLLDLSKIESGRVVLQDRPTELRQVVEEVRSIILARAVEKGLSLVVEVGKGLPFFVLADGLRLRQVLINLAGNAVKFTTAGRVVLRVLTRPAEEGPILRFEVEDTGVGIPEEARTRIFQAFVQLGNTPAGDTGTGLGLAISKQIVELMGGHIGITGAAGGGALFFFNDPQVH